MKPTIILTTLSIALLAGCATDQGEETQAVAKTGQPARVENRLREPDASETGKMAPANQAIVFATPAPAEDESLIVRADQDTPASQPKPAAVHRNY